MSHTTRPAVPMRFLVTGPGQPDGVALASAATLRGAEQARRTLLDDVGVAGLASARYYSIVGPFPGDPADPTIPTR